jgi:hypothetical protein
VKEKRQRTQMSMTSDDNELDKTLNAMYAAISFPEGGEPQWNRTKDGAVDVTEQEKQRLRKASHDYWRAAENLKRINSSQQ